MRESSGSTMTEPPMRLGPDAGVATGWFDRLYQAADAGDVDVPCERARAVYDLVVAARTAQSLPNPEQSAALWRAVLRRDEETP